MLGMARGSSVLMMAEEPSEYFLIKRGVRFAFQNKDGLSNDDSSPILLMRQ